MCGPSVCGGCESGVLGALPAVFLSCLVLSGYAMWCYPLPGLVMGVMLIGLVYYDRVDEQRFIIPFQDSIPSVDHVLEQWHHLMGPCYIAYHHHCYRLYHLMIGQLQAQGYPLESLTPETCQLIGIVIAFHDIGIWTEKQHANDRNVVDYLPPSIERAKEYIQKQQLPTTWIPIVTQCIEQHHKITPYTQIIPIPTQDTLVNVNLVELLRRSDWMDAWFGVIRHGISRRFHDRLLTKWPYHRLQQLIIVNGTMTFYKQHPNPFKPLPMMRL